ncbi:MAG: DUF169 domain-containing protein [Caldilineaceae bacterium]
MTAYATLAQTLQDALKLKLPPIAVSFTNAAPTDLPTPATRAPAGCVFWEQAATGPLATTTQDHELCAVGVYTHNLTGASPAYASELGDVLKVMAGLEYAREEDLPLIPVLSQPTRQVVYAPLAEAPLAPDVVLLFAQASQGLIIAEAIQQVEMGIPPALGRPACAVVPQVANSGRAALSLGCCGARAYLDNLTDDVALWALPGATLGDYVDKIAKLAHANELLTTFHTLRRQDVAAGQQPTYGASLARLNS